jgi:hypothetical protein
MLLHSCGSQTAPAAAPETRHNFAGFDRNDYPGDVALPALRGNFAFTGYWLNNPPGATTNTWLGHRQRLVDEGFGFLVLWNGRLDKQIKASRMKPAALGQKDAAEAIAAARREGFPDGTVIFLDQEEGGRLLTEQAGYLLGWTEAVAGSSYRPGAYVSGQPVEDGPGATITTAQDVTGRVKAGHLHPVALWVAQDACPPAPGCTVQAPELRLSGTPDAVAWQYAQSPRRPEITRACAKTYADDGNCYGPSSKFLGTKGMFLDMNVAASEDPSHGR